MAGAVVQRRLPIWREWARRRWRARRAGVCPGRRRWRLHKQIVSMLWNATEWDAEQLLTREWLVTNGLGGYASGTVGGMPTPLSRAVGFGLARRTMVRTACSERAHLTEQMRDHGRRQLTVSIDGRLSGGFLSGEGLARLAVRCARRGDGEAGVDAARPEYGVRGLSLFVGSGSLRLEVMPTASIFARTTQR